VAATRPIVANVTYNSGSMVSRRRAKKTHPPTIVGRGLVWRWAVPVLATVAVLLLPWTVWLTVTLPSRHVSEHWDAAWVGFDAAEFIALALLAYAVWKRTSWLQAAASAAGTLLIADAWFDVLLSAGGRKFWVAVAEAIVAELPLAALCYAIAWDVSIFLSRWRHVLELAPPSVRERWLHLAATGERSAERDLVRILEVAADGEAAREPRDADAPA
jgi:hypothetical protein